MRSVFVLLLCATGLTGCISALPPSVEVVGAEVAATSDDGARVEVALVLANPNDVALPLPEASYTVEVEGLASYAYIEVPSRVLGPKGVQAIRLPAAFETEGQDLAGQTWRISGSFVYEPENYLRTFLTESGVPLPLVLFSGQGVLE